MNIELIKHIAEFILDYWSEITWTIFIIVAIWGVIAKLTPWKWDDKAHAKVKKFIDKWFPVNSKRPPFLLRTALKYAKAGTIPWWLKILIKMRFGKFTTSWGVDYRGIKVYFKW